MKSLPAIGTKPFIQFQGKEVQVEVVAHFNDYAVIVFELPANKVFTSSLRKAEDFIIVAFEPEQDSCPPAQHNYIQIREAHENRAFCTRCGKKISLE